MKFDGAEKLGAQVLYIRTERDEGVVNFDMTPEKHKKGVKYCLLGLGLSNGG
jgi:hypothetical protein